MEFQNIVTAIGSLGFPIVACCVMFMQNEKQQTRHAEETALFTEAINELKVAITSLTERLLKNEN